jgi:hypothetical protein
LRRAQTDTVADGAETLHPFGAGLLFARASVFLLLSLCVQASNASATVRCGPSTVFETGGFLNLPLFTPAQAYWKQRRALCASADRIRALSAAVDHAIDCHPYQFAQLVSAALEFEPDVILELGRGKGNSTCAFTEASYQKGGSIRVVSICNSPDWRIGTAPRLRPIVPASWFTPVDAHEGDILTFDFAKVLVGARRVLLFWDAHGFAVAECVLGGILPLLAPLEHVVIMHDLSDSRYGAPEQMSYGPHGLWKGNNWEGPRLKIGFIDSAVEQSIAALDFTTRNRLSLDSADHSIRSTFTEGMREEMATMLGDLFSLQAHWFYFTLNEQPGPYTFPRFERPASPGNVAARAERGWRFWKR